ncbi:hypothetical glycosyltransferase [Pelotomaculum thermopropionicum SI]|uniref:Hypothetical glycosyltransferase n=1 Tax=Pelotomaculum thermopropionicum (strain DSM 13744 / JCM 10971 / SI) TaxID=370438 RepID=A5CZ14_PELTS|nr:hypothetical glycosyltransferase [Pelotomaculum thermopropionicum SI]
MKSGSVFAKAWWLIIHEGPAEMLRRASWYVRNRNWKDICLCFSNKHVYQLWLKRELARIKEKLSAAMGDIEALIYKPLISTILPLANIEIKYLEQTLNSVLRQAYPCWELCAVATDKINPYVIEIYKKYQSIDDRFRLSFISFNSGVVQVANAALSMCVGEFVGFLDCGDELAPHALLEIVKLLNREPKIDAIYTDEDRLNNKNKRSRPLFKPGWSPDLLLSMNYVGRYLAVRKSLLDKLNGFREDVEGVHYHDMLLRLSELTKNIVRLPEVLYHRRSIPDWALYKAKDAKELSCKGQKIVLNTLARCGIDADVWLTGEGHFRVKYHLKEKPLVSIIIPTRDKINLLTRCINSILEKTTYKNYEIIVVDNGSIEKETKVYLDKLKKVSGFVILNFDEPFNYSKINNFAVEHANGDYLLFLNNDTEVITTEWLEEMIALAQKRETGAVGVKLLFPDGTIQHGGVIIGLRGIAGHAFYCSPADKPGYMDFAVVCRNYSAVTAACMMMRRDVFYEVGGFDQELDIALNDIDLCLRVINKGYYVVWTPYVLLYHQESKTRGQVLSKRNISYFLNKWEKFLDNGDLFYNPNLSLSNGEYRIKL